MIIAVCDPKGIAIEAIKTILYHDKGLSDRISRIYEFWNMEQLLDASRDSSFDCIVFPNYCNSHICLWPVETYCLLWRFLGCYIDGSNGHK